MMELDYSGVKWVPMGTAPTSRVVLVDPVSDSGTLRTFETGATRDTAEGKHEPWGFCSALVEKRFSQYMHAHRKQSDGELRESDNWKKGIPVDAYYHSLSRHIQDLRLHFEGFSCEAREENLEEVLCSVLFNVQGMLHEVIKKRTPQVDEHVRNP